MGKTVAGFKPAQQSAEYPDYQKHAPTHPGLSLIHIFPLLVSRDVIHGYKTIFPIPLGHAATFNPQIVENGARVAAIEASADGIRWTFAPMIDISRDPRWGRIAEQMCIRDRPTLV